MSMQRIYNYGSSLQGYGLRRLIEGLADDVNVSFVDYEPGPILVQGSETKEPSSRFGRVVSKVREYNQVDARLSDRLRFLNHKRTYAARNFPMLGITAQPNRDLDLDVQVIGSDEVFNCVQANSNVGYSRDLFGHNSPASKVISYAGSFGNTTLEKLDSFDIRGDLERDFARFSAISVRDENSAHHRGAHRSSPVDQRGPRARLRLHEPGGAHPQGAPARGQVPHRLRLRRPAER